MALDTVTVFELHFDGAQFGPRELPGADSATEETVTAGPEAETEAASGRSHVLALVTLSVGFSVVATIVARRLAGDGEQIEVETVSNLAPEQ